MFKTRPLQYSRVERVCKLRIFITYILATLIQTKQDIRVSGQTHWQVSSQVHASCKKKSHFKVDISCISLANNRLMDVTKLALTWVGWPNGEKLALTSMQIWSQPKWVQVIASQRRCTQALAKQSRKLTQVFNLRLLGTPFGQGFTDHVDEYYLHASQVAHQATAYPGFCSMKHLGRFLTPPPNPLPDGILVHHSVAPSIKFDSAHLYTWVARGTAWLKCLAQHYVPGQSSKLDWSTHGWVHWSWGPHACHCGYIHSC